MVTKIYALFSFRSLPESVLWDRIRHPALLYESMTGCRGMGNERKLQNGGERTIFVPYYFLAHIKNPLLGYSAHM